MIREPWLSKYAFGIDEIDHHHRTLYESICKLDAVLPTGDSWVAVQQILNDLGYWARIHFAVEESLMRLMRFDQLDAHAAMHLEFMGRVSKLKKQSLRKDIARDTSMFLTDWLRHHVDIEDRKYADFLLARFGGAGNPITETPG
jgi:hemerythrin